MRRLHGESFTLLQHRRGGLFGCGWVDVACREGVVLRHCCRGLHLRRRGRRSIALYSEQSPSFQLRARGGVVLCFLLRLFLLRLATFFAFYRRGGGAIGRGRRLSSTSFTESVPGGEYRNNWGERIRFLSKCRYSRMCRRFTQKGFILAIVKDKIPTRFYILAAL